MKFDTFLSAEDAVAWGLADKIIEKRIWTYNKLEK
jgi:ATP-dependent protease ClpP protease subunit